MNLQPVDAQPDLGGSSGLYFYLRKEMHVEPDLHDVPLCSEEFKNSVNNDSVSQVDQAYESNDHPNDNIYYEESEVDYDEDNYDDDDANDDDDMQTFEEWRIEFEIKNAESATKLKEDISDIMNEKIDNSRHELSKMLDKGFSKMQKHIDTNINNVVVTMNEKIGQQVDYFDNMVLQHQMTISTFGDFKTCLDELSSRVDNVTSMVEGMVVGPQSHYEGPPTVASAIGRPVNLIGDQQHNVFRKTDNGTYMFFRKTDNGTGTFFPESGPQ